jgi:hypothetical protein
MTEEKKELYSKEEIRFYNDFESSLYLLIDKGLRDAKINGLDRETRMKLLMEVEFSNAVENIFDGFEIKENKKN